MTTSTPGSPGVFPLCFASAKDFAGWQRNARRVQIGKQLPPFAHCDDCTGGHQWKMLLASRCENPAANPEP